MEQKSKIPDMYTKLKEKRDPFEERAKKFANFTIPNLYASYGSVPQDNDKSGSQGWQGIGAQCINSLANKMALTLFPAQAPFFTVQANQLGEEQLAAAGLEKTAMTRVFAQVATNAMQFAETTAYRVAIVEAFKHLLVTGNICLHLTTGKKRLMQAIPLSHYVVKRDMSGTILELILLREKSLDTFDMETQTLIRTKNRGKYLKGTENIKFYTRCQLLNEKYEVSYCADEITLPKTVMYNQEDLPYLPLTWHRNYAEDYGRGLVEDHQGDFYVIRFLSESLARGMALMADVKFLIKPGAYLDINKFVKSRTGDALYGVEDDIHILQLGKHADFTTIDAVLNKYEKRVGVAFMVESLNRREGERVTAYEIRRDALELEQGQGGAYSLFSSTMQQPLARWFIAGVSSTLNEGITPDIITGTAALGKMAELEKFQQLSELLAAPAAWSEPMQADLHAGRYRGWCLAQLSMDVDFFLTEEEKQEQAQAQQEAQASAQIDDGMAKALPQMLTNEGQQ